MYNVIIFDLDGTLTNPFEGVINAAQYALEKLKIDAGNAETFNRFIGPPLLISFQEIYSLSEEDARRAVTLYREYYGVRGMYENSVYEGIPELLALLRQKGKILFVATTKAEVFAAKILQHFQMDCYFSLIVGSNLDGTRSAKDELIKHVLDTISHVPKEEIVMVGDRLYDIEGVRANGISSIAVTYGFGTFEELTNAKPDYLVSSVEQLKKLLIEGDSCCGAL